MKFHSVAIGEQKHIALVAHDNKKQEMLAWVDRHQDQLAGHLLYATGTTGSLLESQLQLAVTKLISGPLGGDQQIGSRISTGDIDLLVFFWDPFEPLPHDPDVKALLRIAAVWNIPVACNQASADFMLASPLMRQAYARSVPDYDSYIAERLAETR